MSHEERMRAAIDIARQGMKCGQTPFGAALFEGDRLICATHNRVWDLTDITAHAEILAIREACAKLRTIDLSNLTLYSTCEPCPMCFSASHWARIRCIVYGAGIADAEKAGFNEISLSNEELIRFEKAPIELIPNILREECAALFDEWKSCDNQGVY